MLAGIKLLTDVDHQCTQNRKLHVGREIILYAWMFIFAVSGSAGDEVDLSARIVVYRV